MLERFFKFLSVLPSLIKKTSMKTFRFWNTTFFAFIFSCALSGCFNSYVKAKPVTPASAYPAAIQQAKQDNRSFILHSGTNVYSIYHVELDQASQALTVQLHKLDSLYIVNVEKPESGPSTTKRGETAKINQIHIYTKDSISYTLDEPHTIPLENVEKIDLLGKS